MSSSVGVIVDILSSTISIDKFSIWFRNIFQNKMIEDNRTPVFSKEIAMPSLSSLFLYFFGNNNEDSSTTTTLVYDYYQVTLLPPANDFVIQTAALFTLQVIVAVILSIITYYGIIVPQQKRRRTDKEQSDDNNNALLQLLRRRCRLWGSYAIGFGLVIPVATVLPFWLIEYANIRNKQARFGMTLLPLTVILKCCAAMFGDDVPSKSLISSSSQRHIQTKSLRHFIYYMGFIFFPIYDIPPIREGKKYTNEEEEEIDDDDTVAATILTEDTALSGCAPTNNSVPLPIGIGGAGSTVSSSTNPSYDDGSEHNDCGDNDSSSDTTKATTLLLGMVMMTTTTGTATNQEYSSQDNSNNNNSSTSIVMTDGCGSANNNPNKMEFEYEVLVDNNKEKTMKTVTKEVNEQKQQEQQGKDVMPLSLLGFVNLVYDNYYWTFITALSFMIFLPYNFQPFGSESVRIRYGITPEEQIHNDFYPTLNIARLYNSFVVGIGLFCHLSMGMASAAMVTSLVARIQFDCKVFNGHPLFRSTSPSDFWGKRWNRLIHTGLKEGIYKPILSCTNNNKVLAKLATFVVSGLTHEYILALCCYKNQYEVALGAACGTCYHPVYGRHLMFFAWNGVMLVLEDIFGKYCAPIKKYLPSLVCSHLVMLTSLPVAHLLFDDLLMAGYFESLRLGIPLVIIQKVVS